MPFAKYSMLFDSLINENAEISIDTYLYDPKKNSVRKEREKISFVIQYSPDTHEIDQEDRAQAEIISSPKSLITGMSRVSQVVTFPLGNQFIFNSIYYIENSRL